MRLNQLRVEYDAEHDRLLMLVAAAEGVEARLWLTRRYVKLLWPMLVKLAEETSPRIRVQANPEARKALLRLEHEEAIARADFSKPYQAAGLERQPGTVPIVVARMQTGRNAKGLPIVALHPADGEGLTLTLDPVLLHSLCRLLQAAVRKSDWDMDLKLPGVGTETAEGRTARSLN